MKPHVFRILAPIALLAVGVVFLFGGIELALACRRSARVPAGAADGLVRKAASHSDRDPARAFLAVR